MTIEQKDTLLSWLENWYRSQCDGDWEHSYGVRIDTLDNPGWSLDVDLSGTSLEDQTMAPVVIDRSETDWVHCRVESARFLGRGGASNLGELVARFRSWAEASEREAE